MHPLTVFSKSAKAVLDLKNKSTGLDRQATGLLLAIDGKSTLKDLAASAKVAEKDTAAILANLLELGYIQIGRASCRERV